MFTYTDFVNSHIDELYAEVIWRMNYPVRDGSKLDTLITELIHKYATAKDNSANVEGWADDLLLNNGGILTHFYRKTGCKSVRKIVEDAVNSFVDDSSESAYEDRYSVHPSVYAKGFDI